MKKATAAVFSLFLVLAGFTLSAAQDVRGSKDHPLLSRMPGFHIGQYEEKEYDKYEFLGKDGKRTPIEGHYYHLVYQVDGGKTDPGELKTLRNIQDALGKIGGKVLYDRENMSTVVVQKGAKESWVAIQSDPGHYQLYIVEKEMMKQEVVANAESMGNDISSNGHVSIYGIHFDTGKSTIRPESEAAISEIAELLKKNDALRIYVVGHTDNVGPFDSNMKLSKDRADAVAKALTGKHGIAATRLKPYGVASLSPVTTNDTEEGRAKNRRVELVKQ